jgi:putative tricarboxylic transport membrane protein
VLLIVMCAAILVQAAQSGASRPFVRRDSIGPVLKVLWPAVAAVVLMQWIGLYVASVLYTGFYMRWIGRHSWLAVVAVAVGFPLAAFFIFEKWFLVPMPKGPLEAWLGY